MAHIYERSTAGIGPKDLTAIVQLQLEDSGELLATRAKGKQRECDVADAELALRLYIEDLQTCDAVLQDRKMAQSIAVAIMRDFPLLQEAHEQEQQVARDRELAAGLSAGTMPDQDDLEAEQKESESTTDPWSDAELLAKAAAMYMQPEEDGGLVAECPDAASDAGTVAESSAWAASREYAKRSPVCTACGQEQHFFDVARVPCKHEYCRACLETLFRLSMKDETLFPPRCDGKEIPLALVRFFLPSALAKEFEEKYNELSTSNRTYCFERSCSAFIPTAAIHDDVATCQTCRRTTCAICKAPSHSGDCPKDTALQKLVDIANVQQWQRCYQCNRFVELGMGCNHMTCHCGAQFCYVCGLEWKTCSCERWDENRLENRAAQIVERHPRRRLFQPQHVVHPQPVVPQNATRSEPTMTDPAAQARQRSQSRDVSEWESDFSDHSVWEEDWPEEEGAGLKSIQQASEFAAEEEPVPHLDEAPAAEFFKSRQPDTGPKIRSTDIAEAMEYLRENHECTHHKWRWVSGGHTCEQCQHWLKEYIFECRQCLLQACNRCRRNRL